MMKKMKIINALPVDYNNTFTMLQPDIETFVELFRPLEADCLYVLVDRKIDAVFVECHILASKFLASSTIDVPLDPDEQSEYRANRDIVANNPLFLRMIDDAQNRRSFSNIVTEYQTDFDAEHPLKVIGGQHRYAAIAEAYETGVDEYHGVKVYFGLDSDQRMDVQIISNTNIDVSPDLLDRVFETKSGPDLRNWCQKVGLLEPGEDFADKHQQGPPITVRTARTFIMNYYLGSEVEPDKFAETYTMPLMGKTGGVDQAWEELKTSRPHLWDDQMLLDAGKEFVLLAKAQVQYFSKKDKKDRKDTANGLATYNYGVIAAWSFVSGVLSKNKVRLARHYSLKNHKGKDPLNTVALADGRHKTDPQKYRGLVTRFGSKERGRLTELFFAQAEKGDGISKPLVELAITKYHAKIANLEVAEKEAEFNND